MERPVKVEAAAAKVPMRDEWISSTGTSPLSPAVLFFLMRLHWQSRCTVDIDLRLPAGNRRQSTIRGWCCGGAKGRDRTLRLSVIRLRPRTFPRLVGPRRGCPTAPLIAAVAKSRDQGYWGLISVGRAMVEAAQQH